MNNQNGYWTRKATPWVSVFVLVGCIAITSLLVYSAVQANVIGDKLSPDTYTAGL